MKRKTFEAARLIAIRKASGLTQARFAERLFVSRGTYANYEAGRQMVPKGMLEQAALAVQIKTDRKIKP